MRAPRSTYRLQVTPARGLAAAAQVIDYLHDLGADWVYLSPLLASEDGSDHGYDVVDHGRTDPARGGRAGLDLLARTAHGAGMGILVDIVPNHVGIATPARSVWWWDVLTHGRKSLHAKAFDIDWDAGGGRIRLPVLGDGPDELAALRVVDRQLMYYEKAFPIAPGTGDGTPQQVHHRQHYELVSWRRADAELNYRRFFAVSSLAGIRVEDPAVFDAAHAEIRRWIEHGWVDGLRVDHPDGLADPNGYLRALAALSGDAYTLVEKILEPGEELPTDWACAGTTGYDTLALVDRLFTDPDGQGALDTLDADLHGNHPVPWPELTHSTRRGVADGILRSEVLRLARLAPAQANAADAVAELLSSFHVYRSYLPAGAEYLSDAVTAATARRPELAGAIAAVAELLGAVGSEMSVRFQQTSGMVMAKGVEDCAFYRFTRLTSLTEVGADPSQFAIDASAFHGAQARRLAIWPNGMTTLSTHDTKRGEDVRARISVLSEIAPRWAGDVRQWLRQRPFPDGPLANLLLQAAVGGWPIERARLHAYAEKAAREAGERTSWSDPDEGFEKDLHALVDAMYDDPSLHTGIAGIVAAVRAAGWSNALSAKLIQLTLPGVPDVYQGSELWETSLVDPDNRRGVDFAARREMLARIDDGWLPPVDATGAAKLLLTSRALRARRDRPELFAGYAPLSARGPEAGHLVAFDRGGAITLATRLAIRLEAVGGWGGTEVALPARDWTDALTGRTLSAAGPVRVADLLDRYPAALLLRRTGG